MANVLPILLLGGGALLLLSRKENGKKKSGKKLPLPKPPGPTPTYLEPGTHDVIYNETYHLILPEEAHAVRQSYDPDVRVGLGANKDDKSIWYAKPDLAPIGKLVESRATFYSGPEPAVGRVVAEYVFRFQGPTV